LLRIVVCNVMCIFILVLPTAAPHTLVCFPCNQSRVESALKRACLLITSQFSSKCKLHERNSREPRVLAHISRLFLPLQTLRNFRAIKNTCAHHAFWVRNC
jgi:hypothetical protein